MTIFVDPLIAWGWVIRGRKTESCHMFADTDGELHALAAQIGLQRRWAQHMDDPNRYRRHYDLTPSKRAAAVSGGAVELSISEASRMMGGEPLPERFGYGQQAMNL